MNVFWQGLFASLVVALFTGLTILAYRHPKGYDRMYAPMLLVLGGVWGAWAIYQFAYSAGYGQAVLETLRLNSPALIKTPTRDSAPWWYFFLPAVVYGYLGFLRLLPLLLDQENSKVANK